MLPWTAALVVLAAGPESKPEATWAPAHPGNYTAVGYDRGIKYIVVHTVEGSAIGAVSWFQNPSSNVSAHYVVSKTGKLYQCVKDKDIAWHAGNWYYNQHSIGIEHEGWTYEASTWTEAMYQKSAALVRWLCDTYGIPKDRAHILGHNEVPGATHTDPGPYFNWSYFMSLVKADPAPPPKSADTIKPSSKITTSGSYSVWPGHIEGTASDVGAGLAAVAVAIRRPTDGRYWTGVGWTKEVAWLGAVGTTRWTLRFKPELGLKYEVRSKAIDKAGNTQDPPATSTFVVEPAVYDDGGHRRACAVSVIPAGPGPWVAVLVALGLIAGLKRLEQVQP